MPSNHLILCHPLLLPPSIFSSIRVFSNESALCIRWPKYWSFSFNISLSNEHSGLISFRMDWLDLLAVQGTLKSLLQHHSSKASILWCSAFLESLVAQRLKRLPGMQETQVRSLRREDPLGEGKWQPTSVLLPGESNGGRSLVGYSPWGGKESDTTERLHFHFHRFLQLQLSYLVFVHPIYFSFNFSNFIFRF